MGFADTLGNVIIKPQFAFVCPFKDGKAEVTYTGEKRHWMIMGSIGPGKVMIGFILIKMAIN